MTDANQVSEPEETPDWKYVIHQAYKKLEAELSGTSTLTLTRGREYKLHEEQPGKDSSED